MTRTVAWIFLIFTFLSLHSFAQEEYSRETGPEKTTTANTGKKWHFGGGFGLNFGTITQIYLAPQATYSLNSTILMGGGITYIYNRVNYDQLYPGMGLGIYSSSVYGASLFNEIHVFQNLFTHLEWESLNLDFYDNNFMEYRRQWFHCLYAGGGIRQPVGQAGYIQLMLLYDLINKPFYPYGSRFIPRISFYF